MSSKRVVVAMSGGVDSSVCAALLKDKGFEVIGITMQLRESSKDEDAKKVADILEIAHQVVNFRDIFEKRVVESFCEEYRQGRTPNPCILCNKYIKFGALLEKAKQLGADFIATGHYARIEFDKKKRRYLLKKGIDSRKEQSYFLYALTQEQLKATIMPLGELVKEQVRKIAKERDLPVKNRLESQEICFIPDNNYGDFLKEYIPEGSRPGPIVNKEGKIIGEHRGIIFYTIGQRKGIGIAAKEPLYVTSIDKANNTIVVGKKEDAYRDELTAENVNFISIDKLEAPIRVEAKMRYLHPVASATIIAQDKDKVRVNFEQPQLAVTPGQAAVFYQGDIVIGGGTICSS